MHVLHVINGLGPGGAETVLFRLVQQLSSIEHEIVSMRPPDFYSERLKLAGFTVHHLNMTSPSSAVTGTWRLQRLLRNRNPDVVQCWMYRANLVAGSLGRIAGKPVVWNIRHSSLEELRPASRILAHLGGALARWVPSFVINCSGKSAVIHARLGYGAVDGCIVPNGYDPAMFYPDEPARAATREALGVKSGSFVLGAIGRWHPQKGIAVLLEALGLLRRRGITPQLLMAGRGLDGANRPLTSLIEGNGCADQVTLLGERSDIPAIARSLDVHILASVGGEGFPNVVAETMLSGTPNIATDVGDAALIVNETGWIVPPRDAEKLAHAIEQSHCEWKNSPPSWEARRRSATQRIRDNFSVRGMAEAYEAIWRRVTDGASD